MSVGLIKTSMVISNTPLSISVKSIVYGSLGLFVRTASQFELLQHLHLRWVPRQYTMPIDLGFVLLADELGSLLTS